VREVLNRLPLSEVMRTPSVWGMARTLSPGSTLKSSRISRSRRTRYRSSTLSMAKLLSHVSIILPTVKASLPPRKSLVCVERSADLSPRRLRPSPKHDRAMVQGVGFEPTKARRGDRLDLNPFLEDGVCLSRGVGPPLPHKSLLPRPRTGRRVRQATGHGSDAQTGSSGMD